MRRGKPNLCVLWMCRSNEVESEEYTVLNVTVIRE